MAATQDFDAFYAQPCPEEIKQHAAAKPIQVLTFDGKGGGMRQEALRKETRKRAEASAQKAPRWFARQDKSKRKRMATVAGIYYIDRQVRSPQSVAQQLRRGDWSPNPVRWSPSRWARSSG